jgi:AMMECR1 domain-containing protein
MKPKVFLFISSLFSWLFISFVLFPSNSSTTNLTQIVYKTMQAHFESDTQLIGISNYKKFADSFPVEQKFQKPAGLFITLSLNNAGQSQSRACWGSVNPEYADLVKATVYTTIGALTKEYRYSPIRKDEWKRLKAQVTIINAIEPVKSIRSINPLKDGLMIRSGNKSGVILPGEAMDSHYQLILAKLKAGIKKNEGFQIYRLKTEIHK